MIFSRLVPPLSALAFCVTLPLFAQPAPTPEEVKQAQVRWNEGKASFEAGNFEAARIAFKQPYIVYPHPVFLQNLGEAELRCGRQVEAARHLSQFIRTANATPTQRDAAKKSLKKASEALGSVVVETNTDDSPFLVDSISEELAGRELSVRRVLHPVVGTIRDERGHLERVTGKSDLLEILGRPLAKAGPAKK